VSCDGVNWRAITSRLPTTHVSRMLRENTQACIPWRVSRLEETYCVKDSKAALLSAYQDFRRLQARFAKAVAQ
jgi:hypothetical protein